MLTSSIQVRSIGEAALDWLSSEQTGTVVAAVTHAIYLLGEQNELFWLNSAPSPMHRRCLLVSAPLPRLTAGASFNVRDQILAVNSSLILDFHGSPVWRSPLATSGSFTPVDRLPEIANSVFSSLITRYDHRGWGSLIPTILQAANRQFLKRGINSGSYLLAAQPAIEGIVQACLAHDFPLILEHAAILVGLGEGLTPSGDDFLGGFFFCLNLLRNSYPDTLDLSAWIYSDFILRCKSLTNLISFTLLKDNAQGHSLETLHRFANALLIGLPADHLLPFAVELVAVGHSTGWDILTGFLAGMCVTFHQVYA